MTKRVQIIVEGRVQGVGFRYFIYNEVQPLPLSGYVQNLPNGNVEIIAEGPEDAILTLINISKKGPAMSFVSNQQVETLKPIGEFSEFSIKR